MESRNDIDILPPDPPPSEVQPPTAAAPTAAGPAASRASSLVSTPQPASASPLTAPCGNPAAAGQARRSVFRGRIIEVGVEQVRLPNGRTMELEVVRHPGGAAAVAIDDRRRVCLLRQYRHAAGGWLWELPAGKLDPGEGPARTAERELAEEAGLVASTWEPLGCLHSSPGVFAEVIWLYLALGLSEVDLGHDQEEVIEVHWLPLEQALAWCRDGNITDAKTLIGLFRAEANLRLGAESGEPVLAEDV